MTTRYTHLSQEERYQIYALLQTGITQTKIAYILKRNPATISREITRNKGLKGYRPKQAQYKMKQRALNSRNASTIDASTWIEVEKRIRMYHSPEQIAGSLNTICHETIYRYLYASKATRKNLCSFLRCQKKRRKRYGSGHERRGQIPGRRPIAKRPKCVESRLHLGHWEGDTIIGVNHKQAIVTLVERKSRFVLLKKVPFKQASLVGQAMIDLLSPYQKKTKTITVDNGREFAAFAGVDVALRAKTYFADPYASWQRGTNENTNGLIRQFIPKNRSFLTVTDEEIEHIQHMLNTRPRKRLDYKTPFEVFMLK